MGKRLKRIFQPQLTQQKSGFLGKEVCVVTTDARTVRGKVMEICANELLVLDMSLEEQKLELKTIAEIVLDYEADY